VLGLLVVFSIFLIIISIYLGMSYARTRTIFKTTNINGNKYIVVREYNSQFILKGVDSHNHLKPNIKVVPTGRLDALNFQQEEIKDLKR